MKVMPLAMFIGMSSASILFGLSIQNMAGTVDVVKNIGITHKNVPNFSGNKILIPLKSFSRLNFTTFGNLSGLRLSGGQISFVTDADPEFQEQITISIPPTCLKMVNTYFKRFETSGVKFSAKIINSSGKEKTTYPIGKIMVSLSDTYPAGEISAALYMEDNYLVNNVPSGKYVVEVEMGGSGKIYPVPVTSPTASPCF